MFGGLIYVMHKSCTDYTKLEVSISFSPIGTMIFGHQIAP